MEYRGGAGVIIGDLDLVPRILFATDGSINHILEAYACEPVDQVRLASRMVEDTLRLPEVASGGGERALERLSLVRGRKSGRVFVHTQSVVLLGRLPEAVAEELLTTHISLLRLLTQHRIGTFRETVAEWEGLDEEIASCFGIDAGEILVGRTYEVVTGGAPIAWVTETFPKGGFSLRSDQAAGGMGGDIDGSRIET